MNRPDPRSEEILSEFDFQCRLAGRDPDAIRAAAAARLASRLPRQTAQEWRYGARAQARPAKWRQAVLWLLACGLGVGLVLIVIAELLGPRW